MNVVEAIHKFIRSAPRNRVVGVRTLVGQRTGTRTANRGNRRKTAGRSSACGAGVCLALQRHQHLNKVGSGDFSGALVVARDCKRSHLAAGLRDNQERAAAVFGIMSRVPP